MRVEIWSDIACPWCYIGKARFEKGLAAFAGREGVEVVHRSFELDPKAEPIGDELVTEMLARKYGVSRQEAAGMEERVAENARSEGLGYRTGRRGGSTFDLHRLLQLAKARGRHAELLDAFYAANFADAEHLGDPDILVRIASAAGLDADEARKVLDDPAAYADDVRADEREAAELGISAVPFFVIDRKYGVSGGQPAEVFTQALQQAAAE
ncbi:DsbA family oxidoreductase [Streptomyces boninensis]|uniref:DsbA family oxidoreductase n=1 Tax=Streptomyces boninensis TaxID=2039455 RepID=UPI003B22009E